MRRWGRGRERRRHTCVIRSRGMLGHISVGVCGSGVGRRQNRGRARERGTALSGLWDGRGVCGKG